MCHGRRARSARVIADAGELAQFSLKSNLGHLDAAAGVSSFIKAVLCLEHGKLVPSLHYENPNSQVDFAKAGFRVTTEREAWEAPGDHPRRAAVSSFGLGGTNAHVVLEEAPPRTPRESEASDRLQLLTVSASAPGVLNLETSTGLIVLMLF